MSLAILRKNIITEENSVVALFDVTIDLTRFVVELDDTVALSLETEVGLFVHLFVLLVKASLLLGKLLIGGPGGIHPIGCVEVLGQHAEITRNAGLALARVIFLTVVVALEANGFLAPHCLVGSHTVAGLGVAGLIGFAGRLLVTEGHHRRHLEICVEITVDFLSFLKCYIDIIAAVDSFTRVAFILALFDEALIGVFVDITGGGCARFVDVSRTRVITVRDVEGKALNGHCASIDAPVAVIAADFHSAIFSGGYGVTGHVLGTNLVTLVLGLPSLSVNDLTCRYGKYRKF